MGQAAARPQTFQPPVRGLSRHSLAVPTTVIRPELAQVLGLHFATLEEGLAEVKKQQSL